LRAKPQPGLRKVASGVWMDEMDGMDLMDGPSRALLEGTSITSIRSIASI
jgi:hypothetical protein